MVSADQLAARVGEVMQLDVKTVAIPRAQWPAAFEQLRIPNAQTGPIEVTYEASNA
jgi:hypothetical protein